MTRQQRLIDLFSNRKSITGNAFEYYRQTLRDNNATTVQDHGNKPESGYTVTAVTDRARVIAHLSEEIPARLLADHQELEQFLADEMAEGVLDALEAEIIAGDGSAEHFTGLLSTEGITPVAFDTDVITSLRSGVTALQLLGVMPTGWVLHPNDAMAIDLLRYSATGAGETAEPLGFLVDGYQNGNSGSGNVFGPTTPRVVSPSVPEGTAILADWSQLRVYIREDVRLDVDTSGSLFQKNEVMFRAEGRFGIGVLRPSSFAVIALSDS